MNGYLDDLFATALRDPNIPNPAFDALTCGVRDGNLKAVVAALLPLSLKDLEGTLLRAGFSVPHATSNRQLLARIQEELLKAVKDRSLPRPKEEQPAAPQTPGEIYAQLWRRYVAAHRAYLGQARALMDDETAAVKSGEDWVPVFGEDFDLSSKMLHDIAERIVSVLVMRASKVFAPAGCRSLKIPYEGFRSQFLRTPCGVTYRFNPDPFDPAALWAELERLYGGNLGHDHAHREAATAIMSAFDIRPGLPVVCQGAWYILTARVWLDTYSRDKRLSYDSQNALANLLSALGSFAVWSDNSAGLQSALGAFARRIGGHDYIVQSRERIPLCSISHIVTYHGKFQFMLARPLGEQLQIYLSLYGQAESLEDQEAA